MKIINPQKLNPKSAFTIIETLVTLLAISIMISAPLTFMVRSYNYSQFIKAKIISTGLSQEGLELATSMRNENLANFRNIAAQCSAGCRVDWNGVSTQPSLELCSGESCRLFKSSTDQSVMYRINGDVATDYYRYLKFTANGTQSYLVESISYSDVGGIKVEVNLKKVISNIQIK